MSKVWLITGSASGLGADIANAVLASGDRLVATARDPGLLSGLREQYGDLVRTAALDVTDAAASGHAVQLALDQFGRLDVLVNNAGFGHLAPLEQTGEEDFRAQIDTNFYGVVNLTRAALPAMRQQRSGRIIQISSVGGRIGSPGLTAYQAAKWAVGGFSEALQQEVAELGIRVSVLEPGAMTTGWAARATAVAPELLPDYESSFGKFSNMLKQRTGVLTSDPARVAQVVLGLAYHDNPPLHLLLGSDAVRFAGRVETARAASDERWRAISVFTDSAASVDMRTGPATTASPPLSQLIGDLK
jgi:NAD(P)-dependent dehydrogenase (short-subunit alcohol dehydrogenase family)